MLDMLEHLLEDYKCDHCGRSSEMCTCDEDVETEQLHFTYEPLSLTRLMLQIYLENKYHGNEDYSKSVRFALFEFMRSLEDQELEDVLSEYVSKDKIEYITLDDKDCEGITHYIMQNKRYKDLVFMYQKKGYSGLGVADNTDKTFYNCDFAQHWQTVGLILRQKYGKYGKAFDEIMYLNKKEYSDISSEELDKFILNTFQLVGESKSIEDYLKDR
ncbi:hypothetical protein ABE325_21195 [Bacillus licheniformis]|uniref:hypothetical protein n=1 Tax=Bacillus licheniformis TaxID=1402 RepID=UPI000FF8CFCD|nr:hypothetical protein [Bacillus licheniformis]QAS18701.1 hypothetical protein EQJ69_22520 [Bacillus licheniformis]